MNWKAADLLDHELDEWLEKQMNNQTNTFLIAQ